MAPAGAAAAATPWFGAAPADLSFGNEKGASPLLSDSARERGGWADGVAGLSEYMVCPLRPPSSSDRPASSSARTSVSFLNDCLVMPAGSLSIRSGYAENMS